MFRTRIQDGGLRFCLENILGMPSQIMVAACFELASRMVAFDFVSRISWASNWEMKRTEVSSCIYLPSSRFPLSGKSRTHGVTPKGSREWSTWTGTFLEGSLCPPVFSWALVVTAHPLCFLLLSTSTTSW